MLCVVGAMVLGAHLAAGSHQVHMLAQAGPETLAFKCHYNHLSTELRYCRVVKQVTLAREAPQYYNR